jgi:hypothetical protein
VNLETVTLRLAVDQLNIFFPILQSGVTVPAIVGCSLKGLLCEQFAIPADYVTDRITTIFLDNRPVDDIDRTVVQDGSRITLSAAMPGLVGATMRRGGFYAALRQGISHVKESGASVGACGIVRLKLFNLLLAELGPLILARGLILEKAELDDPLKIFFGLLGDIPTVSSRVLLKVLFSERDHESNRKIIRFIPRRTF